MAEVTKKGFRKNIETEFQTAIDGIIKSRSRSSRSAEFDEDLGRSGGGPRLGARRSDPLPSTLEEGVPFVASLSDQPRQLCCARVGEEEVLLKGDTCTSKLRNLVESDAFGYFITSLVMVNAVSIGMETDYAARHDGIGRLPFSHAVSTLFCYVFTVEVSLRVGVHGLDFFWGPDWRWNLFDFLIVGLQWFEQVADLLFNLDGHASAMNFGFLRILRTLRVVRIMRLARVLHLVVELRTMVSSIVASLKPLFWATLLFSMLIYAVAVAMTQISNEYRASNGSDGQLERYFCSLGTATLALWECISGGMDWQDRDPGRDPGRDDSYVVRHVLNLFKQTDLNEKNAIDWKVFQAKLDTRELQELFEAVEVNVADARSLFRLIDTDNSGSVTPDELMRGWIRLQGPAKAYSLWIYRCCSGNPPGTSTHWTGISVPCATWWPGSPDRWRPSSSMIPSLPSWRKLPWSCWKNFRGPSPCPRAQRGLTSQFPLQSRDFLLVGRSRRRIQAASTTRCYLKMSFEAYSSACLRLQELEECREKGREPLVSRWGSRIPCFLVEGSRAEGELRQVSTSMSMLLPVTLEHVFTIADAETVVACLCVSGHWSESARRMGDRPRRRRVADKVYVPKKFSETKGSYLEAYWGSLKDSRRSYITPEELCRFEWSCRMKSCAGSSGLSMDTILKPDGSTTSERGDGTWRFVPDSCGRTGPKGSFIRLSLNFHEFPSHMVSRWPKNWGFLLQNCWGFSASFPLPPRNAEPELEDAGEICRSVTPLTCREEAEDYNYGFLLPYSLMRDELASRSGISWDPSPRALLDMYAEMEAGRRRAEQRQAMQYYAHPPQVLAMPQPPSVQAPPRRVQARRHSSSTGDLCTTQAASRNRRASRKRRTCLGACDPDADAGQPALRQATLVVGRSTHRDAAATWTPKHMAEMPCSPGPSNALRFSRPAIQRQKRKMRRRTKNRLVKNTSSPSTTSCHQRSRESWMMNLIRSTSRRWKRPGNMRSMPAWQSREFRRWAEVKGCHLQGRPGTIPPILMNWELKRPPKLQPGANLTKLSQVTERKKGAWNTLGLEMYSKDRVAIVIMSGGKDSRIGGDVPKGLLDVGLLSHKSIFQLYVERIRRLQHLVQRKFKKAVFIPLYIMCNRENKEARDHWKDWTSRALLTQRARTVIDLMAASDSIAPSRPPPPWVIIESPEPVGVFYVDESKKPEEPEDTYISIEVRCETQPEEAVGISGSDWQLGSWNPQQSWYLNTSAELYPIWKDRLPMPSPGGHKPWAVVVYHSLCLVQIFLKNTVGEFIWEPLPCNRTWPRGLTPDTEVKLTYGESGLTTVSLGWSREKKSDATYTDAKTGSSPAVAQKLKGKGNGKAPAAASGSSLGGYKR
eukprot:g22330.t1